MSKILPSNPSTFQVYTYLKKNRMKKKQTLYKLALGISIDKTIAIYLAFTIAFGLFIAFDFIERYESWFTNLEAMLSTYYLTAMLIFLIRPVMASFTKPGILFSSAEFQISLLPYEKKKLWLYCVLEKWLKTVALLLFIATLLVILTPFSRSFIYTFAGIIITTQLVMTIPQWNLFRLRLIFKLLIAVAVLGMGALLRFMAQNTTLAIVIGVILLILLLALHIPFVRYSLRSVPWAKIVRISDLAIWNMWFINKVSNMQIIPPNRQGLFQTIFRSEKRKKPFNYHTDSIYKHLWKLYFMENKDAVIKTIGSVIIVIIALSFQGDMLFGLGLALALFLFQQMAGSFFLAQFSERLLYYIPWDLEGWEKAFKSWTYIGGLIVLVPLSICLIFHSSTILWLPLQLLFYIAVFGYVLTISLFAKVALLSKSPRTEPPVDTIVKTVMYLLVIVSVSYPIASLAVTILYFKRSLEGRYAR